MNMGGEVVVIQPASSVFEKSSVVQAMIESAFASGGAL